MSTIRINTPSDASCPVQWSLIAALFTLCGGWTAQAQMADDPDIEGALSGLEPAMTIQVQEDLSEPVQRPTPRARQGEEFTGFVVGDLDTTGQIEASVVAGAEVITITLDDVLLEDAVRMFAQTTGANIITSGALMEGKRVTVNLQNVEWRPALRSILEIHNFALTERTPGSGIYSIQPREPDAPEATTVETYFLDYTTVSEVKDTIQSILRPGATLTPFPSRNALVVRATENNMGEVRELISVLDRPGKQVLIEAKIMELTDEARKNVGIDWQSLDAFRVGVTGAEWILSDEQTRTLSNRDRAVRFDHHGNTQGVLDFRDADGEPLVAGAFDSWGAGPSFTDDGTVIEQEWENPPHSFLSAQRAFGEGAEGLRERVSSRSYRDARTAVLSPADFTVIMSALERTEGVSIVSNPKMIVTSGSTNAFFSVGEREPIIETEIQRGTQESPGDREIARLATQISTDFIREGYLETGIDLRVVATVKTEDFIEADIRPSLRRLIGEKTVGGNSWPVISVKEIGTQFTLRSGQTVAIGGLTGTEDSKSVSRVPILGRIPIIGRLLFTHTSDGTRQVETIIFVTLSVADPDGLQRQAGIPVDARLVHDRMLHEQAQREKFMREFEARRIAAEAAMEQARQEDVPAVDEEEEEAPEAEQAPEAVSDDAASSYVPR